MAKRFHNVLLFTSTMLAASAMAGDAATRWSTLTPKGEGFSIEVPGEPTPKSKPGDYAYSSGLWSLFLKVDENAPVIRNMVEGGDRKAATRYLERIADSMTDAFKVTKRNASTAPLDGYASVRVSFAGEADNVKLVGINRLVLTEERSYILVAIGPQGQSGTADAERFIDSFRIIKGDTAAAPRPTRVGTVAPSKDPLAAQLTGPMFALARLLTEEKLSAHVDQILQNSPAARRLGAKWNPSHPSWQKARTALTRRITQIEDLYEQSGELDKKLEAELTGLGSKANAVRTTLSGPAGPAILRAHASMHFVVRTLSDDPDSPNPGDPGWPAKTRALHQTFDAKIGDRMPPPDRSRAADVDKFLATDASQTLTLLLSAVMGKATNQLEGAINLVLFDNLAAITQEIDTAIASAR